jgi:Calcium-binding EGF domain
LAAASNFLIISVAFSLFVQISTSARFPSWPPSAWRTPSAATYRLITYANAKPVSKATANLNASVSDLKANFDEKTVTFVCDADIDECNRPDACGHKAVCQNTAGNYTCSCPSGYGGNPYDGVSIRLTDWSEAAKVLEQNPNFSFKIFQNPIFLFLISKIFIFKIQIFHF